MASAASVTPAVRPDTRVEIVLGNRRRLVVPLDAALTAPTQLKAVARDLCFHINYTSAGQWQKPLGRNPKTYSDRNNYRSMPYWLMIRSIIWL